MIKGLRRICATIALTGTVLAGTLFTSGSAAQAGCGTILDIYLNNGVLGATHWQICFEPPERKAIPMLVMIERLDHDPTGGVRDEWVVVARGRGDITYNCLSRGSHTFRLTPGGRTYIFGCN